MNRFEGKSVLVTGGNSGIGLAAALGLTPGALFPPYCAGRRVAEL